MRRHFFILFLFISTLAIAQELNCVVTVVAQQTGNDNNQVFQTLERQLTEFINNTQWTDKKFKTQERINCSMVINVQNYSNDAFSATLQVQSSRPVFGSTYSTPVYTFNDKEFQFRYLEFQNLVFNKNQFESNLISTLAFHIYMILGMDADTFAPNGGNDYYRQAQTIVAYSAGQGGLGWKLEDGLQSRFALIDNLLSPTYKEFRSTMYSYHRDGLDFMHKDLKKAKEEILSSVSDLQKMHGRRPNSFLMRVFFDSKANEVSSIFSGGPSVNISQLINTLNKISPTNASKWKKIKF
ncbi:DUF4835 domain-containing protein [Winogradskyella sp. PC-19]|uniref:type IX secretion system protein PorD n=1 Tax=unclassified Winogradskyella TaxID=2615021 RepID=UPI000B3C9716|nr:MULTISPECIES: DUF4835 family protein [unclassified Winogradskyella]ARV08135.1 DUF4835 domain-containing protein [Winogradskyella sp. PC-19]